MKQDRRTFLKSGAALLAAAALSSCSKRDKKETETRAGRTESRYPIVTRTLGRTGIEIPIVSMGGQAEDRAVYEAALDAGIVHIDTDYTYRHGRHERMVGEIVRKRGRDALIVGTKINIPYDGRTGLYRPGTRGEDLVRPLENSLRRLGVEYLDILYLHSMSAPGAVTYEPVLETLRTFKSSGRTRSLGVSVHGYEPSVMRAAADCGVYDVIMTSYNFKQRHAAEMKEAIAYAAGAGLGIIAMKTQAGAFIDRERKIPVNHRAAIKWVLSDTNVHTAIPGFSTIEQLEMFLSVMSDLELTPEEEADLASARSEAGLYCMQCGRCLPQCPFGVRIPSYMRAYMYAYGYRDAGKAKRTIEESSLEDPPCRSCGACGVSCAMGFDVRERVTDIARLRGVPDEFIGA